MLGTTIDRVCWMGALCLVAACDTGEQPRLGDDTDAEPAADTGDADLTTGADPQDPTGAPDQDSDSGDGDTGEPGDDGSDDADPEPPTEPGTDGRLFTIANDEGLAAVVMFSRDADGALDRIGEFPTGGMGTGGGLGSQGAIALDGTDHLYVVNAGDNTISSMRIHDDHLGLVDIASSDGVRPTSLALGGDRLYVLNADGPGGVAGFELDEGLLLPIPEATRPLSGHEAPAPAQVGMTPDGKYLVVTERATDQIVTYEIDANGGLGDAIVNPSEGQTPFGFAFTGEGVFVVSEAFGGGANPGASAASSYRVADGGGLWTYSASVPSGQTAACWLEIVGEAYAYTTNTASNTLSGYEIAEDGSITLDGGGVLIDLGEERGPIDMAVSADEQFLYVLNGASDDIVGFTIGDDGSLTELAEATDVPESAVGLAGF